MAIPQLLAIIYCAPDAIRFTGEPLRNALVLPDTLPARVSPIEHEIQAQFISPHLRASDVPLAFHREFNASSGAASLEVSSLRANQDASLKLEAYGRRIQYLFSDGVVLYGNQILFHANSKHISRHLLPLSVNVSSELRSRLRFGRLPAWQIEADQAILSLLLAAARSIKLAARGLDVDAVDLRYCHDDNADNERTCLSLNNLELAGDELGPWRLSTDLPEPVSGVHYGRARFELDPDALGGDLHGLAQTFFIDLTARKFVFHGFEDQLQRLKTQLSATPEESGLSLHLTGHSHIQVAQQEMNDLLENEDLKRETQKEVTSEPSKLSEQKYRRLISIYPNSQVVPASDCKAKLAITSDGSFRFQFDFKGPGLEPGSSQEWEAHGIPQSSVYLLMNLLHGLGATTGYANAHIAHTRRGLKRERDMKILRSIGYSTLIFYDAANFALGLPLSDGTLASSEREVCESLFLRLGSLVLKSEGWPVQTGSLSEICSKNVTTLIEGFVKQILMDFQGRDISIFVPHGELRLQGLSRSIALLFHALVGDLAELTHGACFSKARTCYFENFMNGRPNPEKEDMAVRIAVDPEIASRMIYQPGISERYLFPDAGILRKGTHVLGLLHRGFHLTIDGKFVEEFDAADFRPEFNVRDTADEAIPTGGFKIDWFELNPKFFFKGTEISTDQAARLSRDGLFEFQGRLYRVKSTDMPQLNRLTKFWSSIQAQAAGTLKGPKKRKTEDTYFQLPRSQTLELLALRASGVKVKGGKRWDEVCQFYDSLDAPRDSLALPESFKASLQPYQMSGVQWIQDLFELGLGGILADDMGLGKTVTTLGFLDILRSQGKMGPSLVLVPTSLTYNWLSEASRFAPELKTQIFSSKDPEIMLDFLKNNDHAMVICTYGLLQEHVEFFQQVKWNCLVLDEAQNLKNITTKRTTATRKLSAHFKLCLTGTPLENHYGELFSLFDLIVPGSLGDISGFREHYVNPVRVLREDIDFLKLKIKPLLMRRTKAQVMHELPPKIEATVKLPFEDDQRRIYRDIASSYNEQVKSVIARQGEAKSQLQMLTALLRLRQVCSDPSSVPGVKYNGEPPKITTLLEALRELTESGASALVFTQFLATFERIRASLSQAQVPHFDISGADSRLAREKKIRGFQESERGAVMLMTLKTGGVGLNLVKASYIFHIEPWWNPAVENQATDRAHRIGQTKTVQVYRYLIKDSVEEKIEILKDVKSKRFDALFAVSESESEGNQGSSALTQRDFEFLLS